MEESKKLLDKENIIPRLQLAIKVEGRGVEGTGTHTVKLISDKLIEGGLKKYNSEDRIDAMEYLLEKNGVKMTYTVKLKDEEGVLNYFVQKMALIAPETIIILEYKRKGLKGFIDIREIPDEEIPVIENDAPEPRKVAPTETGSEINEEDLPDF